MLRQKYGSIINISSILGTVGIDPDILATSNYIAAKHGIIGLTKSAAVQYGPKSIRVNAIAPGFIEATRLSDVEKPDNKRRQGPNRHRFQRDGRRPNMAASGWIPGEAGRTERIAG